MPLVDISGISQDAMNLVDMLDGVLERVVNTFASYSVPLPARRYWTLGQSAIDCEQLTITLTEGYLGSPGNRQSSPQRCNMPRSASLLITIARTIPTMSTSGRPPSAQLIEDGAKIGAIDAWVLLQSINELDQWDDTGFGIGVIASLDISPPEGGYQLVTMQVEMAIP